ncbi:replication initiator [Plantactinospora sp. WMMB334]|uniref:replication initiator n=1 Tax=Plantactinospora sp. WMMB334 TaxID=3404119 RepID=UPI003B92512B
MTSFCAELSALLRTMPGLSTTPRERADWFDRKADLLERVAAEDQGCDPNEVGELARTARVKADELHGLTPGRCTGKVHQRSTLGFTGRRVLVSRQWSGKTLADHRADNRAWIRAILAGGMADTDPADPEHGQGDEHGQAAADNPERYRFELARPEDPDVLPLEHRILRAVSARIRWRTDLDAARQRAAHGLSATAQTLAPAA